MSESREVLVLGSELEPGVLTIAASEPWDLTLELGERRYAACGADLFDSLTILRGALEADGLLICVEGACVDVYPSGMSRQMAGGRRAYRHVSGRRPDRTDLVDIFDSACCHDAVSVEEQLVSVRRLRSSE